MVAIKSYLCLSFCILVICIIRANSRGVRFGGGFSIGKGIRSGNAFSGNKGMRSGQSSSLFSRSQNQIRSSGSKRWWNIRRRTGNAPVLIGASNGGIRKSPSKNLRKNVGVFAAGALGAAAGYSLMHSLVASSSYKRNRYHPGYGTGAECFNTQNFNGTVFNIFRCPLNNFPLEAKSCCGDYGEQYCCVPEDKGIIKYKIFSFIFIISILVCMGIFTYIFFVKYRKRKTTLRLSNSQSNHTESYSRRIYRPPPPSEISHPPFENQNGRNTARNLPNVQENILQSLVECKEVPPPTYNEFMSTQQAKLTKS